MGGGRDSRRRGVAHHRRPEPGVASADTGATAESLGVVRQGDVDDLSDQASRGGLARLSANQRILLAVILIAAVFPVLLPEGSR